MVGIPPIKTVMNGGWFMTLLYQHYTLLIHAHEVLLLTLKLVSDTALEYTSHMMRIINPKRNHSNHSTHINRNLIELTSMLTYIYSIIYNLQLNLADLA